MISEEAQKNIRELLEVVSTVDLMVVAALVTAKAVEIQTREDAVQAILLHESSTESLLNRKKITKAYLFKYLHIKQIPFDGSLDKASLCSLILEYWEKQNKSLVCSSIQNQDCSQSAVNNVESKDSFIEKEMAHQFCNWFYSRLNEDFLKSGGQVLNETDFWSDCDATILLPESSECGSQSYSSTGAPESVILLREFRAQYDLLFSPNLIHNGVKAKCDPHGLVLITASGTLHSRSGDCVGIFDQAFGLVPDPLSENNYKIKRTNLRFETRSKIES